MKNTGPANSSGLRRPWGIPIVLLSILVLCLAAGMWCQHSAIQELKKDLANLNQDAAWSRTSIDAVDVLEKVDGFYNRAWTMLVVAGGALGLLVGVVVPLVIQHQQRTSFDRTEKRLTEEIDEVRSRAESTLESSDALVKKTDALAQEIGENRSAAESQLKSSDAALREIIGRALEAAIRDVKHSSAMHWINLAEASIKGSAWTLSLRYWCFAANSGVAAGWPPDAPWWPWLDRVWEEIDDDEGGCLAVIVEMGEAERSISAIIEAIESLLSAPDVIGRRFVPRLRDFRSRLRAAKPDAEGTDSGGGGGT